MRAAVRASAKWLRMLLQRSMRLARDLTAERRRRSAIRELHRLDDRTPARRLWAAAIVCFAIGSTMAAESVPPVCVAADLTLTTLIEAHGEAQDVAADTLAQAFFTVMEARKATAGAAAAETRTGPPPVCVAADLKLMTLIEAHGEARDVAPEVLAQAFFTVLEARKACNQGQVEAGMKFYESIPLLPVISETD